MGLLDSLVQVAGQALSSGQGKNALLESVLGMLQNQPGGLGGLVQSFQNKGLGEIAASWVGTGQNLPISAEQLQGVLGNDTIGALAGKFGLSTDQMSGQLSDLLPQVVDKLTPNGQVEGGMDMSGALGMLQGLMGK
ncbi:MAG: YidB family protein [Burkholderiales bacterium]